MLVFVIKHFEINVLLPNVITCEMFDDDDDA